LDGKLKESQQENIKGLEGKKAQKPQTEDYDTWKARMLATAQARLMEQESSEPNPDNQLLEA